MDSAIVTVGETGICVAEGGISVCVEIGRVGVGAVVVPVAPQPTTRIGTITAIVMTLHRLDILAFLSGDRELSQRPYWGQRQGISIAFIFRDEDYAMIIIAFLYVLMFPRNGVELSCLDRIFDLL